MQTQNQSNQTSEVEVTGLDSSRTVPAQVSISNQSIHSFNGSIATSNYTWETTNVEVEETADLPVEKVYDANTNNVSNNNYIGCVEASRNDVIIALKICTSELVCGQEKMMNKLDQLETIHHGKKDVNQQVNMQEINATTGGSHSNEADDVCELMRLVDEIENTINEVDTDQIVSISESTTVETQKDNGTNHRDLISDLFVFGCDDLKNMLMELSDDGNTFLQRLIDAGSGEERRGKSPKS